MYSAYFRLARLDKPIGIWLLWAPTAWALWLANQGKPSLFLVSLFFLGTIIMRAAGCIVNDMADRNFDGHVLRTQHRPLATGELSLIQALLFLAVLLLGALTILFFLPKACIIYALIALALTLFYPFCKRFLQAPQFILGLAFSMSIPMVYAASNQSFNLTAFLLLILNTSWTLAYDTQYAMVDKQDDLQIGIKSTAILFADHDITIITLLQLLSQFLWIVIAKLNHLNTNFYFIWLLACCLLAYQYYLILERKEGLCFKAFLNNAWYGLLMWGGLIISS